MTIALIPLWASTTLAAVIGMGIGMLLLSAIQRFMGSAAKREEEEKRQEEAKREEEEKKQEETKREEEEKKQEETKREEETKRVTAAPIPPVISALTPSLSTPSILSTPSMEIERNQRLQEIQTQDRRLREMEDALDRARSDQSAEAAEYARTCGRLNAEMEQKDLTIRELRADCEQHRSLAQEYRERLASLQERDAVCAAVRTDLDRMPSALQEFAGVLLDVDGMTRAHEAAELLILPDNIDLLDRYVYRSLPPAGMVIEESGHSLQSEDLLRLVALQGLIHAQLRQIGLQPIQPATGDLYEVDCHTSRDEDLIWINDDPQRHNRVASVKRIGYRSGKQILRKAEVRRFMFLGRESASDEAPRVEYAPPTPDVHAIERMSHVAEPDPIVSRQNLPTAPLEALSLPPTRQAVSAAAPERPALADQAVGRVSAASLLTSEPPLATPPVQQEDAEAAPADRQADREDA